MTAQEIVDEFIGALERGDVDGAIGLMSDDAEYDNVPMSKAIGHEQIRGILGMFVGPDNPVQFKIIRQAAAGDIVMNERIDHLSMGGKNIELPVAGVFE